MGRANEQIILMQGYLFQFVIFIFEKALYMVKDIHLVNYFMEHK